MACVNIIGAGLAGLSCALTLARAGQACRLVSPQTSERAQSVLAEGGINAALDLHGEDDSPEQHFEDTMRGGVWLADPNAVRNLTFGAPGVIADLISIGVPFQVEGGRMVQRYFGGQKKRRTAYAKSSTGKVLVTALIDAVRRFEAAGLVTRLAHHEFVALDLSGGTCQGVVVQDSFTGEKTLLEGPVVLASGGMGGMFGPHTTGTTLNTGDVAAEVFSQGVEMANLEFLQYHPTTVAITGKRMLISEAARGEGGRLFALRDGESWYFMEERYPELGNLMPRDVVSREEERVMADPSCTGQVWLDMRGLPKATWDARLSDLREEIVHYLAIDPAREPVPVEPGIHYCMGGVLVDEGHRTNVAGLYAAGEAACQYHGANRLGGNSLLGAVFGGKVAARSAMEDVAAHDLCDEGKAAGPCGPIRGEGLPEPAGALIPGDNETELEMEQALARGMSITRDRDGIEAAMAEVEALGARDASTRMANRLGLARAILASALAREESRGAHSRRDFPQTRDEFHKTTVAAMRGGELVVEFREIPKLRGQGTSDGGEASR